MNKVKIKVYVNSFKFIIFLINNSFYYDELECYNDCYILNVSYSDYKRISRRYKTSVIKYYGKVGLINYFLVHKYMIISFMICLFVLYLLCNTIFDVRVNSDNKEIVSLLINELRNNGIYKNKKKKSFEELMIIKENILENNKNSLEWIEIRSKGVIYIVEVTPRVVGKKTKDKYKYSSIYASSDGVIKRINVLKGTRMVDKNDYVHKGDVLISGNILKDEKVVKRVNAKGNVYAEVWEIVNISIPFEFYEYVKTGKVVNHYYLDIFGKKFTLTGLYNSSNTKNKIYKLLDKPYLPFKLYKEVKVEYTNKKYILDKNEAYSKGLKLSEDKIKSMLNNDEYIISKKVLKKESNYSKIKMEVFFKIYKNIGHTSNIDSLGETNGESNQRSNN